MSANNEIHLYSNEGEIHRFFPYIQTQTGTVLGVGSDQVLDLFANTEGLTGAILADRTEQNCIQTQIMLEAGRLFLEETERMPLPEEFIDSFRREKFRSIEPKLEQRMSRMKMIKGRTLVHSWLPYPNANETRSLSYADFMTLRAQLTTPDNQTYAWYSTPDKLSRVINGYLEDRIVIQTADLLDSEDVQTIGDIADELPGSIDCLYLSNVEQNLEKNEAEKDPCQTLWRNLGTLPLNWDDGVILRTAMERLPLAMRVQSPEIKNHPVFKRIFLRWHYNVETLMHHLRKAAAYPEYPNMGWLNEVLNSYTTQTGKAYKTELSLLPKGL